MMEELLEVPMCGAAPGARVELQSRSGGTISFSMPALGGGGAAAGGPAPEPEPEPEPEIVPPRPDPWSYLPSALGIQEHQCPAFLFSPLTSITRKDEEAEISFIRRTTLKSDSALSLGYRVLFSCA